LRRALLPLAAALVAALATGTASASAATTKSFEFPVTMSAYQVRQEMKFVQSPGADGFITAMRVNVVDADGTPVPIRRLMLHHIVFAAVGKPNPTCNSFVGFDSRPYPYGNLAEPFYGAGEERNVLVLPSGYGYPIGHNDTWAVVWMLMNHRGVSDRAFIRWTVTYEPASANLTPVKPYWLDVRNCRADPIFNVPGGGKKGSTYKQTYTYTMPESGRIVAGGGHVHGGAKGLVVSEPDCNNRTVYTSRPAWGEPSHPFYHVRPILHEPGPISMSGFLSQQGYPISAGQRIRLTATYDNHLPHARVMGISAFYLAPQTVPKGCPPKPSDAKEIQPAQVYGIPFRTKTPAFTVPLTGLDANGHAHTISRPPGKTVALKSGGTVSAVDYYFSRPNVSIAQGSTLYWNFGPTTLHNITLANGPRGFASPNLNDGRTFKFHFKTPGTYRLFCTLHPVEMTATVTVRKKKHR
jgi:plastocyanin